MTSQSSDRRPLRVTIHCKCCGDVLDTDRPAKSVCACTTARLDPLSATLPGMVDVYTEYADQP